MVTELEISRQQMDTLKVELLARTRENTILKNKMKVCSSESVPSNPEISLVEVAETVCAVTAAMEYTVKDYDSIHLTIMTLFI